MLRKNIIAALIIAVAVLLLVFGIMHHIKNDVTKKNVTAFEKIDKLQKPTEVKTVEMKYTKNNSKQEVAEDNIEVPKEEQDVYDIKKTDLYGNLQSMSLPLSAIDVISGLPSNIKNTVSKVIETSNGVYLVERDKDKVLLVVDDIANIRHNIEFVEVSLNNAHMKKTTFGYNDRINDFANEIWDYDKNTNQPTKHTTFDKNGDIIFIENWYYETNNPVKYEINNSDGDIVSMRKETLDNDTNLRVEHLFYDNDGKTKVSVTASYDGADVKRFTYYNAEKPSEGVSIFSEYSDGLKRKETIYTSDYKLKNTYTADYNNGIRESIRKFDENNKEAELLIED